jgi:hypothetical protein
VLIGRTILTDTTTYGLWAECPGEAVRFINQIIAVGSSAKLSITLQTKLLDDADSAAVTATNGTMSNLSSTGVTTKRATGLKQLYRYKFEVTSSAGGSDEKFVHFLMHDPMWEVNRA